MAILNFKKNKAVVEDAVKAVPKSPAKKRTALSVGTPNRVPASQIIVRPRVTEKASILSQLGREVVVFEVTRVATKKTVSDAVRELYKVTPEKVAILKVPAKNSMVRGRITRGSSGRKAYVYLKKGEKIEII